MTAQPPAPWRDEEHVIVYTIGHSTRTISEFMALLTQVSVELVVDVRTMPRSRTNPQFNADVLPGSLAEARIDYRHLAALGGLRHRAANAAPSPNTMWRNTAFRNYADYAASQGFRAGLEELEALARVRRCAVMCAEAVWWRCHRRIVADYLLADGIPVAHIMGLDEVRPATPTPGVRMLSDRTLLYPSAPDAGGASAPI